jgi:hypothetical protein
MGIGDSPRPRHGSTGPCRVLPRRRRSSAQDAGPSALTTWPTRDPPATRAGRARRRTRCRGSRPGPAPFGARPARLPQPGYPSMRNSRSAFHHRRHSPFSQGVCKRGIRTRDTRCLRPLLYPPELACWSPHADAGRYTPLPTRRWNGAPVGTRSPNRCHVIVAADLLTTRHACVRATGRIRVPIPGAPNDEAPVGSADRGLAGGLAGRALLLRAGPPERKG